MSKQLLASPEDRNHIRGPTIFLHRSDYWKQIEKEYRVGSKKLADSSDRYTEVENGTLPSTLRSLALLTVFLAQGRAYELLLPS